MGSFNAPIETAFNVTDVMQHAGWLQADLEAADEYEAEDHWNIVRFWELLGNAVWVPRLMDIPRQQRFEKLIRDTSLELYRNPLVERENSISAVTPGVTNGLRERVAAQMNEAAYKSDGHYSGLASIDLWAELEREAAIDFAFRSVRPNFELRRCAMCAKWYEPALSNRSRFCSTDCRKRFNNIRNSTKEEQKVFTCACCKQERSMEVFSGLRHADDGVGVSPLRIGHFNFVYDVLWCVECVREHCKEWSRYIAPLLEAQESKNRAVAS